MVIMAVPYKNFKEKIKITKEYGGMYHIEDLNMYSTRGILYMERRETIE
ncbi:MAG: flavoprotein [Clostridium sp.]|nr:flavoprotein [Clostridium sp.]MCH3962671.1 flavoprotein [Clostridium sp.]MCI2201056.1 flavoprotein [Clostridium sp.]